MKTNKSHTRGKPFQPGNRFGQGRPAGSRNKATLALDQPLEGESAAILRKVIQRAKKGDPTAMRLCLERMCPPRRERPLQLDLPEITTADDISAAFRIVLQGTAQGSITTEQAEHLINVLEFKRNFLWTEEFAGRLAKLDEQHQEDERALHNPARRVEAQVRSLESPC